MGKSEIPEQLKKTTDAVAPLKCQQNLGICELRKPSVRGGRPRLSSRLEKRILTFQSLPVPAQEWLIEQISAWPKEDFRGRFNAKWNPQNNAIGVASAPPQ
jgi:hypothetical protein